MLTPKRILELLRAGAAGIAATAVDVAVLAFLVSVLRCDPRAASLPALFAGGAVNFLGNRHFAFSPPEGADRGSLAHQIVGYTVVELVALALNGLLYDAVLRVVPAPAHVYWAVRLATSHVVFLAWSYPLWRRVFALPQQT